MQADDVWDEWEASDSYQGVTPGPSTSPLVRTPQAPRRGLGRSPRFVRRGWMRVDDDDPQPRRPVARSLSPEFAQEVVGE